MTREEKIKAFEMSLDGATYQEIADTFGVTRQYIEQGLTRKAWRAPKKYECVFPTLKNWLLERRMSIPWFNVNAKVCKHNNTLRHKLDGKFEFTMSEIESILTFTGMTFEEIFGREEFPGSDVAKEEAYAAD